MYIGSNQYFIWFYNHTSGEVSRFAGATPATYGYSGDGGPATSAELSSPFGLFLSTIGVLYFVDSSNNVIRAIDTKTNIITTVAGGGTSLGDGGPATSAMFSPYTLWGNTAGVLYIADTGYSRVRKIATNGIITTIVGNGTDVYNGDGIRAINATVSYPLNCQEDSLGNLYISDNSNYRVRMVSATTGIITTIAGDGPGGNAANTSVQIATAVGVYPSMIQLDSLGNIYFGDNAYVRKLFVAPTSRPTAAPSIVPSAIPTAIPSIVPSAIPSFIPSIVPSAIPTAIPNIVPSTIPTIAPSTSPSTVPTISPTGFPSFRPSVENVTVDSSSTRSQRLSDLHIFYATFFPAFLVAFCILPFVGYYAWMQMKAKKQLTFGEINLDDPPVTANGNEKKTVEVEKFYKWSF
mmetsp:Transcript_5368/g.5881  ORF Transcript_5368/g.5881 Transcript_5368/m.5881 type:complete len:406 (+) Transcript_5368:366-1583(+)